MKLIAVHLVFYITRELSRYWQARELGLIKRKQPSTAALLRNRRLANGYACQKATHQRIFNLTSHSNIMHSFFIRRSQRIKQHRECEFVKAVNSLSKNKTANGLSMIYATIKFKRILIDSLAEWREKRSDTIYTSSKGLYINLPLGGKKRVYSVMVSLMTVAAAHRQIEKGTILIVLTALRFMYGNTRFTNAISASWIILSGFYSGKCFHAGAIRGKTISGNGCDCIQWPVVNRALHHKHRHALYMQMIQISLCT